MPSKHFWVFSAYTFASNYKKNKVSNTSSDYVLAKTLPFRFIPFHSFHVFGSCFAHLTRYTHLLVPRARQSSRTASLVTLAHSFHVFGSAALLPLPFHSFHFILLTVVSNILFTRTRFFLQLRKTESIKILFPTVLFFVSYLLFEITT